MVGQGKEREGKGRGGTFVYKDPYMASPKSEIWMLLGAFGVAWSAAAAHFLWWKTHVVDIQSRTKCHQHNP